MSGQVSVSRGLMNSIQRARISTNAGSLLKLASRSDDLRRFLRDFLTARPPFFER
jgi:hypothetical protein